MNSKSYYSQGQRLKQLRAEREWTQTDLADQLSIVGEPMRQQVIQRIESGERPLRLDEVDALAQAFSYDFEGVCGWLMHGRYQIKRGYQHPPAPPKLTPEQHLRALADELGINLT